MSIVEILTLENPVFAAYGFWASVLVLKVMAMAVLTSMTRKKKKAVVNEEDKQFMKPEDRNTELTSSDPDVERVRR
jgi:glutathione S-transferase